MKNISKFLLLLFLFVWNSCVITEDPTDESLTKENLASMTSSSKYVFDADDLGDMLYVHYLDNNWTAADFQLLNSVPEGIVVRSEESNDIPVINNFLLKLLVKQTIIERKLDLYAQFKDTIPRTTLFEYDKSSEESMRSVEFLNVNFSESERQALKYLPRGLMSNMSDNEKYTDACYSLLAKLLVKEATIDQKLDSLIKSPTIAIDPVLLIREYLKTHSLEEYDSTSNYLHWEQH